MKRATAIFLASTVLASACGEGIGAYPVAVPRTDVDSVPATAPDASADATDPPTTDGSAPTATEGGPSDDVFAAFASAASASVDAYWAAGQGQAPGLEATTPQHEFLEMTSRHHAEEIEAAIQTLPAPVGATRLDAALATYRAALDTEAEARRALSEAIAIDPIGIAAQFADPGFIEPPYAGTSLEIPATAVGEATRAVEAPCLELADKLTAVGGTTLDCSGAALSTPEGPDEFAEGGSIEAPGIALTVTRSETLDAQTQTSGIELLEFQPDACIWIGRPPGLADPSTNARLGTEGNRDAGELVGVPEDLGPWIAAQQGIELLDVQFENAAGSPFGIYWDVGFDLLAPMLLIGLADGDTICGDSFGQGQFWRLRSLPTADGNILMVTQVSIPEGQQAGYAEALDRYDGILSAFEITR